MVRNDISVRWGFLSEFYYLGMLVYVLGDHILLTFIVGFMINVIALFSRLFILCLEFQNILMKQC